MSTTELTRKIENCSNEKFEQNFGEDNVYIQQQTVKLEIGNLEIETKIMKQSIFFVFLAF